MTRFSVIESVRHLIAQYRSFIKSSYRLADPRLREQFEEHVNRAEVLVKGPYVTLARDFAEGHRLDEILASGCGHPDLVRFAWPFGSSMLYAHQEDALRAVEAGRNVIVKTGTGSGKTESFLLPVLSGVLRLNEQGIRGTKAILLYPMNALANDQLVRLRNLLRESDTGVTFALYTGDSETVTSALGDPLAGHELVRRDEIRRKPPDILLTNYKQLEFLLVRKADRPFFTQALRYVVLDELHSYRGALATEIACLLRRLKARCGLKPSDLRAIGTSATVSQDAGGDAALARFATGLFDEPFEQQDIIGERYRNTSIPSNPYDPPLVELSDKTIQVITQTDEASLIGLAESLCGRKTPPSGTTHQKLEKLLSGNRIITALMSVAAAPRTLEELAGALRQECPSLSQASDEAVIRLIEGYLLLGSYGDEEHHPLLRPKLHTFFHGVYDVGLCMNPRCRLLLTDGSDRCRGCGSAVRPAVLCRTCGQDFVKVRFDPDHEQQTIANDDFLSDEETAFITPYLIGERDESDDGVNGEVPEDAAPPSRRRRPTAAERRLTSHIVDHVRGQVFNFEPEGVPKDNLSTQYVLHGRGSSCPVCNSRYTRGDVLTLLRTGVASSVSVLGTHHLDKVPHEERKLLVFADNRQDAAHQAGYMSDRHRQFALRHAIEAAVSEAGVSGIALQDLPNRIREIFQAIGLIKRNLTRDEEVSWRRTLEYEIAGEFCRASHQRIALENLALVEVQYEFLDKLIQDQRFAESCRRVHLDPSVGGILVWAMLDFMRRKRAVSFDFYQVFLDPRRTPWSWLTSDPYGLSIAEYERGAVFFMLDRPEALRSRAVSGIKFEPFVKDSARGAAGGIARLVYGKAGLGEAIGDQWIRQVVTLLMEYEMLETLPVVPEPVRRHLLRYRPVQVAKRIVRLVKAEQGWRCHKCSIWRPYRPEACLASTSCSGEHDDLEPSRADLTNYYIQLYTANRPRRLRALEHTAQIDQDTRAKREQEFKEGKFEALAHG